MNNEGKDAALSREQVERYYAEVTSPDELGITDPRMKAVFDMALRYRDVLDAEVVGVVGKSYEGVYKLPIGTKLIAAPRGGMIMTIETPTPSEMESMIASAKASSNAEMTAAPQMPSEPRQCQHGNWNAADCKDCKIKSLQAECERLRGEVVNRNQRALDGDKATAAFNAEYERAEQHRIRAESAERKLAEYTDERGIVRCKNIATCLDTENKLAEAVAALRKKRKALSTV